MYSIRPRIVDDYTTNCSLNSTLESIDKKISGLANCKLNHLLFNLTSDPDMDLYDDLTIYKKILMNKLLGCNCLDDQRLIKIVSRIKKLTR